MSRKQHSKQPRPGQSGAQAIDTRRIREAMRMQSNPLANLSPDSLRQILEEHRRGYMRRSAVLFDVIEDSDTTIGSVADKRKGAVGRLPWAIKTVEESAEAKRHAEVLTAFYNRLTATSVMQQNLRGGLPLLIKQMMDALGKGYAVHDLVWSHTPEGYTVNARYCPLWFFEGTTGRLRYLPSPAAIEGEEMDIDGGGWLVTVSERALMVSTAITYMFKRLPLGDWLVYCGQQGIPAFLGKTNAAKDSPEWDEFGAALMDFRAEYIALTSEGNNIEAIDLGIKGQLPWEPMVKYADQQIAIRWRGADLSTISAKDNTGASLQQGESAILLEDDADMISDALQHQLSRRVIEYTFGSGVLPLAYIELQVPDRLDDDAKLRQIRMAQAAGIKVGEQWARESLAIPAPRDETDTLEPRETAAAGLLPTTANAAPAAIARLRAALTADMQPLAQRIEELYQQADAGELDPAALQALLDDLEQIGQRTLEGNALESAMIDPLADAAALGVLTAVRERPLPAQN